MTVLVTRPEADSTRFAADLSAVGVDCLIWPLTRIVLLEDAGSVPGDADLVVFTSRHAVRALVGGPRPPALCVGKATADAAKAAGFGPVTAAHGTAKGLAASALAATATHVFYPRAEHVAMDLAAALSKTKLRVTERVVYRAATAKRAPNAVASALRQGTIRAVTVWSARNAELLADRIVENPDWRLDQADLVAISSKAAQPLQALGEKTRFGRIFVAEQPDAATMLQTVSAALRQKSR